MKSLAAIAVLCLFIFFTAEAEASLESELLAVLSDSRLGNAVIAVNIQCYTSRETVFSRNSGRLLIPASNQKIITAAAALDILGSDYEFITTLWMQGEIKEKTLDGHLIILGGGDPSFGSPAIGEDATAQFDRWARLLELRGISEIKGDLIIDQSMFDSQYIHPDWPENQLSRRYSAPVNAFIFHDNCIRVRVQPGPVVGAPAALNLFPAAKLYDIENTCRTASGSNILWVERNGWKITAGGEALHRSGGWNGYISTYDPAVQAGHAFADILSERNIALKGAIRVENNRILSYDEKNGFIRLAVRRAPIDKILEVMLVDSQNLYAESILKTIGAFAGDTGSWETGSGLIAESLYKRLGENMDFTVADGSGYSRNNRTSARLLCELLIRMHTENPGPGGLMSLLPAAGEQGTLAGRLNRSIYEGRIHAKSGYLSRVGSLSGYALARSGRLFIFSILINDFRLGSNWDMRQIQDSVVEALINHG